MYGVANKAVSLAAYAPFTALDLAGKSMLVVGGTGGLGRAIALAASARGAAVTVVGRTFRDAGVANVSFHAADLSLMTAAAEAGRALPPTDVVVLTTGTGPAPKREVTPEGIERDMATSALSRLVLMRELAPRLPRGARVFVWGMPGNGIHGARVDDLNAEGPGYEGNFGWVHQNTVAANEALVFHLAETGAAQGVSAFGCNPGLIATGIRSFIYGSGMIAWIFEGLISLFSPSPTRYAQTMLPLMFAPGLEAHSGTMFGQAGQPILADAAFRADPAHARKWIAGMEQLARAKAGV